MTARQIATRGTNAGGGGPTNFIANRPTKMTAPQASVEQRTLSREVAESRAQHGAEPDDERRQGRVSDDDHRLIIIAGLQDLRTGELDAITTRVLEALAREDAVDAVDAGSLTFLLRRYLGTDRQDLRDALGSALAAALEHAAERADRRRPRRLADAVRRGRRDCRRRAHRRGRRRAGRRACAREWPAATRRRRSVGVAVEACLRRVAACSTPQELVPRRASTSWSTSSAARISRARASAAGSPIRCARPRRC